MCVICVKPAGVEFPPAETIGHMFQGNADGCGFMYARDGKVQIRKGFMKLKKFMKAINAAELTKEDVAVMHFRIATAGSVAAQNTHPFPISSKVAELRATTLEADVAMAHNGWKNSGISGKGAGGAYYLTQFLREQTQTVCNEQ